MKMFRVSRRYSVVIYSATLGIGFVIILQLLRKKCDTDDILSSHKTVQDNPAHDKAGFKPIPCRINADVLKNVGIKEKTKDVQCRLDEQEQVFVPFTFVKSYFDIYGEYHKSSGLFSWSHSYSKVYRYLYERQYDPGGPFMQFSNYDVEARPRVRCISAVHGVPLSTQWDKTPYHYYTQIAQYALAHWSKHRTQSPPIRLIIDDGAEHQANWVGKYSRSFGNGHVTVEDSVSIKVSSQSQFVFSIDVVNTRPEERCTVRLTLVSGDSRTFYLFYVPEDFDVQYKDNQVFFGYGSTRNKLKLTRNLINDLTKGLLIGKAKPSKTKPVYSVTEVHVSGMCQLSNVSLSTSEHLRMFYDAANWLVKNQDSKGGWPVSVIFNKDKYKYPEAEEIPPGWYSGMGQGQALSVLTRAYRHSGNRQYLDSAMRSVALLNASSLTGGVRATFLDQFIWFEEYPTTPNTFVLNGFVYTLLGLYDLRAALTDEDAKETIGKLYEAGKRSLVTLLPLFDTGSGSVYDLRHFTMGVAPKIARWDYHATHINLLYTMASIEKDDIFLKTADRWRGYMAGKRAEHN